MNKALYNKFIVLLTSRLLQTNNVMIKTIDGGIMTSNGSKSLHKLFKEARGLSVCALVETSYYKLLEWFNKRRLISRELASTG
jgi:hypothetical protein